MPTPTSSLLLPEPIAAYFSADRQDAEAVAACFTISAVVHDENRRHEGQAAIAAWKADASARYAYTAEPRAIEEDGDRHIVTAHLSGAFPGSPIDLRYAFTLAQDKIATLEIDA